MNLANVLRVNAANHGDRTAIRFRGDLISYREALDIVRALAAQLDAAGIARDDRVGLAMRDHPVHLLAHFAVAWLGAVIVPVDHRWTHAEQRRAAEAFGVKLLLTDDVTIDGVDCMTPDPNGEAHPGQPADVSGADVLVSLSSGTTGRPKGALVTHENLYERFVSQWTAIGYDARDCFGLVTPLFFGAGRSFSMSLLTAGGSVMLAPPPIKPPEIAEALADPEVTAAFLPPTLLRRLLPLHEGTPLLGNIDYLIVSGEPLYADEARECREKICPSLVGYYASSEGGGISVLAAADLKRTPTPSAFRRSGQRYRSSMATTSRSATTRSDACAIAVRALRRVFSTRTVRSRRPRPTAGSTPAIWRNGSPVDSLRCVAATRRSSSAAVSMSTRRKSNGC